MVKPQIRTKLLLSISAAALMIGCSTGIAERSPIDIASNSVRRTDSYSGVSEVLAPQIKAFSSNRTSVKGQVQLRTAGPFTDSDGIVHRDGAYMEIVLDYATATPNPEGGLYFDRVNWAGGEAAQLADFGATVLDCREDVREIYRVPIGYTGYRRNGGHYGQYGRHGYGGYGYSRHGRRGGHYSGTGQNGDDRHNRDNDDRHGDGQDSDNTSDRNGNVNSTPTGTTRRGVTRRDVTDDQSRVPAERDPKVDKTPRRRIPTSTIKSNMSSRAGRTATATPVSRPNPPESAPESRPAPPPPPAKQRTRTKNTTSRSTDRAFKNTNNNRTRARNKVTTELRYHPQSRYHPSYTDYVVSYSCQRQESLRVFLPRDRLLAAEKNGLLLYLQPRNGIDETVALPPNYISGFLLAAYSPKGDRLTIEGEPTRIDNQQLPQTGPSTSLAEPSADTPIIYGGD